MGLPKFININEVGPREGVQNEDNLIPTDEKVALINKLSQTGVKGIEVTSFVSPKWVPQMADAEELLSRIDRNPEITYRSVFLNIKGLQRALENNVFIDGLLGITASETFSKRNTNKNTEETIAKIPEWIAAYQKANIPVDQVMIITAFGCNFEGVISLSKIMTILEQTMHIAEQYGEEITKIRLTDTMGWANPEQMKRTIYEIRNKYPDKQIMLHLHDTRGLGLANAYAALTEGVTEFDSAVAGLGGCPFAAVKGAAGNIATEDLVFMCEEMGIDTGIDLVALMESVNLAEKIFKRELPGHLLRGGLITNEGLVAR